MNNESKVCCEECFRYEGNPSCFDSDCPCHTSQTVTNINQLVSKCCGAERAFFVFSDRPDECSKCGTPFIPAQSEECKDGLHGFHCTCSPQEKKKCEHEGEALRGFIGSVEYCLKCFPSPQKTEWAEKLSPAIHLQLEQALKSGWSAGLQKEHPDREQLRKRTEIVLESVRLILAQSEKKLLEDKLEILAELEHEQWVKWSQNLATTEKISPERLERWQKLWIPYAKLTEEEKEQDRVWARKVLSSLNTKQ